MPFFRIPPPEDPKPVVEWGGITGNLSNQTDLQSEMENKTDKVGTSVTDNFPAFSDAAGDLKDSGYSPSSFETALSFNTGLTRTGDIITNDLLTGKTGGQLITGDTASGGNLVVQSTSNATKGKIRLGNSAAYDEANNRLGIGTDTPSSGLHLLSSSDINIRTIRIAYDSTYFLRIIQSGANGSYYYSHGTMAHTFWGDSTKLLTINNGYLYFNGVANVVLGLERNTNSGQAGKDLVVTAGGTKSGETDKNGGNSYFVPGISTGTGISSSVIQRRSRSASSATSDNTAQDAVIVPSIKNLANNSYVNLFEVSLANISSCGGQLHFTVHASDGFNLAVYSNKVNFSAVRDSGGNFNVQILESSPVADAAKACSGALSITGNDWAIDTDPTNNKITVKCRFNVGGIVPTSMWIEYTLFNNSRRSVTIL